MYGATTMTSSSVNGRDLAVDPPAADQALGELDDRAASSSDDVVFPVHDRHGVDARVEVVEVPTTHDRRQLPVVRQPETDAVSAGSMRRVCARK